MTEIQQTQTSASEAERLAEIGSTKSILGWIQLLLVIGVLVLALFVNRMLSSGETGPPQSVRSNVTPVVSVVRPSAQTFAATVNTTGTVLPRTQINIAPQVSGRVVFVSPKLVAGGAFNAGEVLLRIEGDDYEASVRQAEADLETARNALLLEEAEAETARREWGLINPREAAPSLVVRGPQIAQANANIKNALARLNNAKSSLSRTRISFPFKGRVLDTTIEVGQTLAQNQSYGSVYRIDDLEVRAEVRAQDIDQIAPVIGREVLISRRNSNNTLRTTIIRSDEQIDAETQLGVLVASLPKDTELRPGAFVNVQIIGQEREDVYALDPALMSGDQSVWRVFEDKLDRVYPVVVGNNDGFVLVEKFDSGQGLVETPPAGAVTGMGVRLSNDAQAG